jgi:hypothetical protein
MGPSQAAGRISQTVLDLMTDYRAWDSERKKLRPRTVRLERERLWLVILNERFWARVDRSGGPDGCWPWQGAVSSNGYGNYTFKGGGERGCKTAQRVAWMLTYGTIPEEMTVDHIDCETKLCMNPQHFQLLPMAENLRKRT